MFSRCILKTLHNKNKRGTKHECMLIAFMLLASHILLHKAFQTCLDDIN